MYRSFASVAAAAIATYSHDDATSRLTKASLAHLDYKAAPMVPDAIDGDTPEFDRNPSTATTPLNSPCRSISSVESLESFSMVEHSSSFSSSSPFSYPPRSSCGSDADSDSDSDSVSNFDSFEWPISRTRWNWNQHTRGDTHDKSYDRDNDDDDDGECDMDDSDAFSISSDHTDGDSILGAGVPVDYQYESECDGDIGDADDCSDPSPITSPSHLDFESYTSFRHRHRLLSARFDYLDPRRSYEANKYRRRYCHQNVDYYRQSATLTQIQISCSAACIRQANKNDSHTPPPVDTKEKRPIASPYYQEKKSNKAHDDEEEARPTKKKNDADAPNRRSNGKENKRHQSLRSATHRSLHSLASPHRAAMVHAKSDAHRALLTQRAIRKSQLKQRSAHFNPNRRAPKNHRKCSAPKSHAKRVIITVNGVNQRDDPTPPRIPDPNIKTIKSTSFDEFRYHFYLKYRTMLDYALQGSAWLRVSGVRFCPIASHVRDRFMSRLASTATSESDVPMVFHGTHLSVMDSICQRGLLVPNRDGNGIAVRNGSAYGVGIYTSTNAHTSTGFTHGTTSTIFVCAAITTGGGAGGAAGGAATQQSHSDRSKSSSSGVVVSGDYVVLMDEARVCPLFLLDFENDPANTFRYSAIRVGESPLKEINFHLARDILDQRHTRARAEHRRLTRDALAPAPAPALTLADSDTHETLPAAQHN